LMTDGENFPENRLNDSFRSGLSPIYKSADGFWSIRHQSGRPAGAGTDEYFVPHLCASIGNPSGCDPWRSAAFGTGTKTQMTWPQVFENNRLSYIAWQFYARALGTDSASRSSIYSGMLNQMRTTTASTTMDTQLQQVCSDARSNNVTVYGIAFEAPSNGQSQIRNCASSGSHYFEASTLNVSTAFRAIATRISQLRLTQ
jgi:hypothetical protein